MGGAPRLSARLKGRAAAHPTGTLGIDEYLETALYDPEGGFYVRAEGIGGARRAFATIPSLSPLMGRAIWQWARVLEGRGTLDLIEVGAGGGHLAAAILEAAGWWGRRSLRYHIVEISPKLGEAQADMLRGRKVVWHDSLPAALETAENPVIVSNELVDAFPCKLLRFEKGDWRERRLRWPPEGDDPLTSHPVEDDLAPFSACDPVLWSGGVPEGQIVEIQPAFRNWLAGWAPSAGGAEILTIDYGETMPDLYRDRPRGTLRGYVAHQRLTGAALFRGPGTIDLTCDVNFTDLKVWGRSHGLRTVDLTDQAEFLDTWLSGKEKARHRADLAAITDPDGAGGAFKVLWQSGG